MRRLPLFTVAALVGVCTLPGVGKPTNQPTSNAVSVSAPGSTGENARGVTARDQQDCVFDDTVETTEATGYPGFDSYELGFDDNNGYNDEGELDELVGGTGGHDVCDLDCQYEALSLLFPYAPRFHVDAFNNGVYWTIYNVYYTEGDFCSGNCWDDQNDPKSDGDTDEIPYFCGIE